MSFGHVYFVACAEPDCRKAHPFIKIGKTNNLKKRLIDLQCGSPVELKYVGHIASQNVEDLERYFHKNFQKAWLYGEWFRLSPGMISAIRHYNVSEDLFDEFFSGLPKFEEDPRIQLLQTRYNELQEEFAFYKHKAEGKTGPVCVPVSSPLFKKKDVRDYEWGKIH